MPFLFVLYFVAYLDRVNVSFAGLRMTKDLGFSSAVFGFGAGVFFLGYLLLEVPGALIVSRGRARTWFARILVSWGICAFALGFIHSPQQFYAIRFFLGLAEAGFFPGVVVYLSSWYRAEDRAKTIALFMTAIPLSEVIGAPLSGMLLQVNWLGFSGWRWMFILEGLPAIVLGIVTFYYLPDGPQRVAWLSEEQKLWLSRELLRDEHNKVHMPSRIRDAITSPAVLLLAFAYFCVLSAGYGFSLWLPKLIQAQSGRAVLEVSLLTALPYLLEVPIVMLVGWHSDHTGERRWHIAVPLSIGAVAFASSQWMGRNLWLTMLLLIVSAMGMHSYRGPFWALPGQMLSRNAAAASIGIISGIGNLGGFVGPYAVGLLSEYTGAYRAGVLYLTTCAVAASVIVVFAGRQTAVRRPIAVLSGKTAT